MSVAASVALACGEKNKAATQCAHHSHGAAPLSSTSSPIPPSLGAHLLDANFLQLVEKAGADANLDLVAVALGVGDVVEDAIKVGERHLNGVHLRIRGVAPVREEARASAGEGEAAHRRHGKAREKRRRVRDEERRAWRQTVQGQQRQAEARHRSKAPAGGPRRKLKVGKDRPLEL